jgi:hypothetical protein
MTAEKDSHMTPDTTADQQALKVENIAVAMLRPCRNNARLHSSRQVHQIAASIREFGFNNPVLIDRKNEIIAGHGRAEAAKVLGLDVVPCIRIEHLSEEQKRAYIIADNKLALNAGWDPESWRSSSSICRAWTSRSTWKSPASKPPKSTP